MPNNKTGWLICQLETLRARNAELEKAARETPFLKRRCELQQKEIFRLTKQVYALTPKRRLEPRDDRHRRERVTRDRALSGSGAAG